MPPEIGKMESLEKLSTYGSYYLHWYPYEILNCKNLHTTWVSTRALYGNFKYLPPFPQLKETIFELYGHEACCSICGLKKHAVSLNRYWVSIKVANDVLPLLVNVCSENCYIKISTPDDKYVKIPHQGGLNIVQPSDYFCHQREKFSFIKFIKKIWG